MTDIRRTADGITVHMSVSELNVKALRQLKTAVDKELEKKSAEMRDFSIHRGGHDYQSPSEEDLDLHAYHIWSEPYLATGNMNGAPHFEGTISARSFRAACDKLFAGDPHYNPESPSIFACKLYSGQRPGLAY